MEGIAIGEAKLGKLMSMLIAENRYDDAKAAADDEKVRERLYEEKKIEA